MLQATVEGCGGLRALLRADRARAVANGEDVRHDCG